MDTYIGYMYRVGLIDWGLGSWANRLEAAVGLIAKNILYTLF